MKLILGFFLGIPCAAFVIYGVKSELKIEHPVPVILISSFVLSAAKIGSELVSDQLNKSH